jgi:hypothetical protein
MMFWPKAEESNPSSRSAHESRNEAVITVAMDQWRKAYRRHAHATEARVGLAGQEKRAATGAAYWRPRRALMQIDFIVSSAQWRR